MIPMTLRVAARYFLPATFGRALHRHVHLRRVLRGTHAEGDVALLASVVRPDDVCWDIGANVGMYVVPLARLSRTVVAFEPVAESRAILTEAIRRLRLTNVRVSADAVCDVVGLGRMHVPAHGFYGGYSFAELSADGEESVATTTIDALVAAGGPAPDFIKCDVEGAESRVIAGAAALIARTRPTWLLETFEDRVLEEMLDLGYQGFLFDYRQGRMLETRRRETWCRNYWFVAPKRHSHWTQMRSLVA